MSTKIHTTVDALGNPTGFHLTGGEVHDLVGADYLLPDLQADTLIADKAGSDDSGSSVRTTEPIEADTEIYTLALASDAPLPDPGTQMVLTDPFDYEAEGATAHLRGPAPGGATAGADVHYAVTLLK